MIVGDVNLWFDDPNDTYVKKATTLLSDHNFTQHITEPTHDKGHILDWLIAKEHDSFLLSYNVVETPFKSDHKAIVFDLDISKPKGKQEHQGVNNIFSHFLCINFYHSSLQT